MTLFEINEALMNFQFDIDEETGEILNAKELETLEMARDEKIENVGLWVKNLKAEAEAIKAEKDAMAKRQKQAENKAKSLENYLYFATQGKPFTTPRVAISYRKSEAVEIVDETAIPEQYVNIEVVSKPNKKAIKDAIKSGETVDGCTLVERENIQIK